jgi:3-deoxy-D-manno-octulosonate 8-phosphate phosphatase (KDO 8-P phosphatase)
MTEVAKRAKEIKIAIFDVDGVLTDGRLYLADNGVEVKAFHVHDGHGLKMLKRSGVETAIISSRTSGAVERRADELDITHLFQGTEDKLSTYLRLLEMLGFEPQESCYMGDEAVDVPVLKRAGLAVSVPQAPDYVREHAHYVTKASGGRGAVRECCEVIMRSQGTLQQQLAAYLR